MAKSQKERDEAYMANQAKKKRKFYRRWIPSRIEKELDAIVKKAREEEGWK